MFRRLGDIVFRRSLADGTPMMILSFGEREAGVPLRSLQHELDITDDSPDGRMLGRIAESLDYVACLRPGDPMPAEVVDGQASWEPTNAHRRTAATRLRLQLLAWIDPAAAQEAGAERDIEAQMQRDPVIRSKVQAAFREAAATLELESPAEVVAVVERLSEETAYIEALRELLLSRVQALMARVGQMLRGSGRIDLNRRDDLTQMVRLGEIALKQFRARFEDVDVQTAEIIPMLRNADSQIAFIRSNRDTLYRSLRGWEPVLNDWAKAGGPSAELGPVITATYHFLAQRYLPYSEWPVSNSLRHSGRVRTPERVMAW